MKLVLFFEFLDEFLFNFAHVKDFSGFAEEFLEFRYFVFTEDSLKFFVILDLFSFHMISIKSTNNNDN